MEGHFEALSTELEKVAPSLFELRKKAFEEFTAVGLPTRKDEEFKYTPFREVSELSFGVAYKANVTRQELGEHTIATSICCPLVFVNGVYAPELSEPLELPSGVIACSLKEALASNPELVLSQLGKIADLDGKLGSTNDERFARLNDALWLDGAFVYVPKSVALENPIHILFVNKADAGVFVAHPRVLVIAEENAQVNVVETYLGLDGVYMTNAVSEVVVGKSALVEHTRIQEESEKAFHIGTVAAHQEANSTYTSTNVQFGGHIGRCDINLWLNGEHTESWLNGTYVGNGEQILDNHTRIDHAQPNSHSFEVYKGILSDKATGVFNGKIFVYEDAQKTDAKQTNQALLLSKEAQINTKPQLEIFADDVKCTHGATIGQLREDAMFYLRARGISQTDARNMLVYAFAAEVLEKITVDTVREILEQELYEKLGA
ncbi:MAG: Fe-S cluster assembly protein SufD [Fimbriimonadaceae bacterium]|nr:Fe-S cluster assembly protein SufD [Fimbriimonadaceae bacterium]